MSTRQNQTSSLSERQRRALAAYDVSDEILRANLPLYCENLVRIKTKDGSIIPFVLNREQRYVHERLENQRARTGKVRAIILKPRQRGISTYIGARFYHRTSLSLGQHTHILTHEDKATQNLFGMVKLTHDNMPDDYRPTDTAKNANELVFGRLGGKYSVGTAKNVHGGGRSQTIQLFHGSEVAFWPHAETHMAGVLQAVPNIPDTEVVLESTGNGVGGEFHRLCKLAQNGDSEFEFIFFPWFWAEDYRLDPELKPFEPTQEELDYVETYELDEAQLAWMHYKNIELGAEPGKISPLFRQEYPANPIEAFQASDAETFIPSEAVARARKAKLDDQETFIVLGCDIARGGKDRTRIIGRQGRKLGVDGLPNITMHTRDTMEIADTIALQLKNNARIRMAFIDVTGVGSGVYDRLVQLGYGERVSAVNFGGNATESTKYLNKRAEMWDRFKSWLLDAIPTQVPDDDTFHSHACAPIYGSGKTRYDAHSRLQLEGKDSIKKRLGFSPDEGDAAALTFAQILTEVLPDKRPRWSKSLSGSNRRGFMTR